MYNIEDLTEQARRSGASDIHLVCGLPPKYRLDGQLENMAEERLSEKDCDMLCQDLAKDAMYEKLEYTGELDFSREIRGIRCRCHVFKQQGKVSAAIFLQGPHHVVYRSTKISLFSCFAFCKTSFQLPVSN